MNLGDLVVVHPATFESYWVSLMDGVLSGAAGSHNPIRWTIPSRSTKSTVIVPANSATTTNALLVCTNFALDPQNSYLADRRNLTSSN